MASMFVTYFLTIVGDSEWQKEKPQKVLLFWSIRCWVVNGWIFGGHFEYVTAVVCLNTQQILKAYQAPPAYSEIVNIHKKMSPG